ncbi:MAG: UDP-2,3-diacylglucosamine diphosphatase [Chitinophagales bacterium]|nr:UDP-2,3-diacylglucosamine diphosphatase [Chitinophagales bacterium]
MSKKTFFASDFHLGVNARLSSRERERQVVQWLEQCAPEAEAIYLVGDIFEFWFEYKTVVPKGYTRLFGQLAALRDANIPVYAFTGNHDLWMFGYFESELDIPVYRKPILREIGGKQFMIGHGDGLGPGDTGYKLMKKVFVHPLSQWLYGWLHPNWGTQLAGFFSQKSRDATPAAERAWLGEDKEWLLQYCERKIAQGTEPDYFVFGHRHLPIDWQLSNGRSRYLNLGEWMWASSYGVFDGQDMAIRIFDESSGAKLVSNYL